MLERLQEKEIIAEIKQKRSEAWVALVDAYSSKLNQRIGVFFTNNSTTNRITREVFAKAPGEINKLKSNDSLWCFLWKIASNHIKEEYKKDIHHARTAKAIRQLFGDTDKISSFRPLDQTHSMDTENLAQIIRFTVSALDSKQQSILLGRFLDAMTTRHISKEVCLHSEKLRKAQETSIKNFYLQFKNLTDIDLIPTYSQNESLDVLTLLIKLLKPDNTQQEDLDIDKLLEISLQEFNKETTQNHLSITLEKTTKISILAILIVALVATLVFMTNKTNKSKSQNLKVLKRNQSREEKKKPLNNLKDNKTKKSQPRQNGHDQQTAEIKASFAQISKLAQNNDIDGLIKILDSDTMLNKMIAAGFLATIGDASAIEPLKRESTKWTGREDINVFKTAIEKINERIKTSDSNKLLREKTNFQKGSDHTSILNGTITDTHGNKIKQTKIRIYTYNKNEKNNTKSYYTLKATTYSNKDGAFTIDNFLSTTGNTNIILVATHPSYGFYYQEIRPHELNSISIELPASSEFLCDIVDEYDNPVKNADVSTEIILGKETLPSTFIDTIGIYNYIEEDGTFNISNLPDGCELKIQIQCAGYAGQSFNQEISGPLKHIRVSLKENNEVQCYLVDTYGAEVTGFIKMDNSDILKSDQYGHIKINFDSDETTSGFAYDSDKKMGTSFTLYNEDIIESHGFEIILKEGIKLSGRIVDGDGNIISDARFRIIFKADDGEIITSPWNLWLNNYNKNDGSFSFEGIPLGLPFDLYIENPTASKSTEVQNIKINEINDLGDIELRTY